jgi:biopolymer transport protein TolR
VSDEKTEAVADINVTPMVDVMLVLLIIFMVVTPALMAGFQATLPQGKNLAERPDDENRVELGIDRQGNYYVNKKPIGDNSKLLERLTAEYAMRPQDKVVFMKADANLDFKTVAEAMGIARDAGARVVAVVSEKPPAAEGEEP